MALLTPCFFEILIINVCVTAYIFIPLQKLGLFHTTVLMEFGFYVKVKVGKFVANLVAAFVRDKARRHALRYRLDPLNPERCVAYLERHYTQVAPIAESEPARLVNPVWVCWLQGREQAPALVQRCLSSIERHLQEDQQLIVITAANYADYISLPDYVIAKWQKGQITDTHFSDIVRIHALARYGGCWIDATCYLTAPVPQRILQAPLFLFRTHGEFSYTYIQSCFMVSRQNSYIMRKWCAALCAYWREETELINYFTLHLLFIALLRQDPIFRQQFAQVEVASDEPMHTLLYEMMRGGDYTDALMEKASAATFIQKLTYKFSPSLLENPRSIASHFSKT